MCRKLRVRLRRRGCGSWPGARDGVERVDPGQYDVIVVVVVVAAASTAEGRRR